MISKAPAYQTTVPVSKVQAQIQDIKNNHQTEINEFQNSFDYLVSEYSDLDKKFQVEHDKVLVSETTAKIYKELHDRLEERVFKQRNF